MILHDCVQGTALWWVAKCGVPSASNFDRILTPTGKVSASAVKYIDELISDRIRKVPDDVGTYTSRAMQEGVNCEPLARQWYRENHVDMLTQDLREIGFITNDDGTHGCSPDGAKCNTLGWCEDLGLDTGLEIKCPELVTHIGYLRKGGLPLKHKPQVHGGMVVCGIRKWDFLSWVPGDVPPLLVHVEWDDYTDQLQAALAEFVERYAEALAKFEKSMPEPEPADESHCF